MMVGLGQGGKQGGQQWLHPWHRPLLQAHNALLHMVAVACEVMPIHAVEGTGMVNEGMVNEGMVNEGMVNKEMVNKEMVNKEMDSKEMVNSNAPFNTMVNLMCNACVHVLQLAPPGSESIALRVLSVLTRVDVLGVLTRAAWKVLEKMQAEVPVLCHAVAWGRVDGIHSMVSVGVGGGGGVMQINN